MRWTLPLLALSCLLVVAAPAAAEDDDRGECVATSTSLHVSVSVAGCLRLIPSPAEAEAWVRETCGHHVCGETVIPQ